MSSPASSVIIQSAAEGFALHESICFFALVGLLGGVTLCCSAVPANSATRVAGDTTDGGGGTGSDETASTAAGNASDAPAAPGAEAGAKCPTNNLTQPCSCNHGDANAPGRQVCNTTLGWGSCQCEAAPESNPRGSFQDTGSYRDEVDPGTNKGPAHFTWKRTQPSGGSCKPGHYVGGFDGIYIPAITFGFGPVPVFGDVEYELGQSTAGEFFEVKDGHMIGSALVAFPFEGDIEGTLDCANGFFEGALKNCYYIIPGLPAFAFEGIIRAEYDKFNHAFVNGVWSVKEIDALTGTFPPPLDVHPNTPVPFPPPFGGTGTWSNSWVP